MRTRLHMLRGVNLGGWLSQCDYSAERLNHFIREEDFARIASWGLDHVRLPIDYNILEDERGGYDAPGWERIDFAIEQCRSNGLMLVLDLHKTAGFCWTNGVWTTDFFTDEAYQERFCRLWEALARRYGAMHDMLVFELLNEITDEAFAPVWNRVALEAIRRIRLIAPDTLILLGGCNWNSAPAVASLPAPPDERVIYNFHCYEPHPYTHQGASWVVDRDPSIRIPFDRSGATLEAFEAYFAPALEKARQHGAALYCGEFGVIDVVDPTDAIKWFRVIHEALDRHGIPRCVWTYRKMDFGIADSRWDDLREELLKLL